MDSKNRKNIVLCGRSGDGKSSIANMLIQGDIHRDIENGFKIGNSAKAVTDYLTVISNEKFVVYDTIGLGDSAGSNEAINAIRKFFSMGKIPLNYICYIKRSRSLEDDVRLFETFKKIFKDGEKNFVIIITHGGLGWAKKEENVKSVKKQLGNYPVISVDFPCNENEEYALIDREQRAGSLKHLLNELSILEYNGVRLKILDPPQNNENKNKVVEYLNFVPFIGSVYRLTASGIMNSKNKKHIVICGRSGDGKSSVANMLIQGDIYRNSDDYFEIGDSAEAVTNYLTIVSNENFVVYDTIGFGDSSGSNEAINTIRNFFSMFKIPLNYICYVKKCKSVADDGRQFKTFKKIFKDGEKNFVIIVTNSGPGWVKKEENVESIKKQLGNYPVISVDFPCNEDKKYALIDREQRAGNLKHLSSELAKLGCEGIKPEVLSPSQNIENNVAECLNFVPVVGSVYHLTSSGFYHVSGKGNMAKKRLLDGSSGLFLDVIGVATGIGKPAALMLGKSVGLRAVKEAVMGISNFFKKSE